ncbi:Serine/threonine-protein kinase PknB [Planctomycetales bacterium 10988]|nr:Serine/threonine-protein kinase PknB [Planctomycetales bacterium 10988]
MDVQRSTSPKSSPFDQTIDAENFQPAPPTRRCGMRFASETVGQMTQEMESVLRFRLQAAAISIGVGLGVFLLYGMFYFPVESPAQAWLRIFHGLVVVILSGYGLSMFWKAPCSKTLRVAELTIFGLPAIFFANLQFFAFHRGIDLGSLPEMGGQWIALIFTYALFIPTSWKRAAIVISMICACPLTVITVMWLKNPAFAELLTSSYLIEHGLTLGYAAVSSVVATKLISKLRTEAYEAKQLGQYRLERLLGAGGMGEVYLAQHKFLKRPCAVKLIRSNKAGDQRVLARFEREVQATASLSHWNTVEIFDYGRTEEGVFYYVMEYLPGKSLQDLVDRYGPLPASRAVHLLQQTCGALREAHEQGILHRDIKPGNIFSAQRGGVYDVAKLLDFGLVKQIRRQAGTMQLTQEQTLTGSPLFMSPEQALGEGEPDVRSDLYSLGATAYFLLTGHAPFEYENPMKVIVAQANEIPKPLQEWNPEIPDDLEQVILRLLEKDPNDRFQTVGELQAALEELSICREWTREDAEAWWKNICRGEGEKCLEQPPSFAEQPTEAISVA